MPSCSESAVTRGALSSRPDWRSQTFPQTPIFDQVYSKGEIADFWEKYTSLSPGAASVASEINLKLLFNTGSGIFKGKHRTDRDICEYGTFLRLTMGRKYLETYCLDKQGLIHG